MMQELEITQSLIFLSVLKLKIQYNEMCYSQEDELGKIGGKTDILNFYEDEKTVP